MIHPADILMTDNQLLIEVAQKGLLAEVLRLIPLTDPTADNSEALAQAARHGHTDCVEALIPVSDVGADNSFALWIAANQGHSDCVAVLIPHSRPKDGHCRALKTAARFGHVDCVEILQTQHSQKERIEALLMAVTSHHRDCVEALARGIRDWSLLTPPFYHCVAQRQYELADGVYTHLEPHFPEDHRQNAYQRYPEYFARWDAQKQKELLRVVVLEKGSLSPGFRKL